jgi:hypothetical protein
MEAKIKKELMGYNGDSKLIPYKFEETVTLSDEIGFNKSEYYGWYVRDGDLDENGIYTNYWHHNYHDYLRDDLNDFDITKCRKIIKSTLP